MAKRPVVYVIAGPNGAGKTTFAKEFLPYVEDCHEFVNADLIASGLSPFAPQQSNFQAGKLVLQRIKSLIERRKSFGLETTLAGRSYRAMFHEWKKDGYEIRIYFLWVCDVSLALQRIRDRVNQGGHDVPHEDVKRRFKRGINNFFLIYRSCVDYFALIDNSLTKPRWILMGDSREISYLEKDVPGIIRKYIEEYNND